MKKIYILLIVSSCLFVSFSLMQKKAEPAVDFFDTNFLRNSPAVEKVLKEKGFFEINFITHDKLTLCAIMLDQSSTQKVKATIISCPGFVPGQKEGMTTLYAMLKDNPYNFLFLDTRGHGKSQGELLTYSGVKHYGEFDFLDIVASAQFIANYDKEHNIESNIIIHGLCSGAFHTIKAVSYLKQHDEQTYNCIKGIVFDSGWPSVAEIAESTIQSEAKKRCKDWNTPYFEPYLTYLMVNFYKFFFIGHHNRQESITQAIAEIDQPILFIHGENDTFIPIHHVYPLIATSKKPTSWFIKESTHAAHHLKHKEEYQLQLERFIKSVL